VRHALQDVVDTYPALADGDFLLSRQLNFETIHTHDVVAERWGTVGEIRGELANGGQPLARHTSLQDWLSA
jgi:GTP cyclohydrolase IV